MMRHSKIGNLMVQDVISVTGEMPFKAIAGLLAEHRISGVPVVDSERRVLGVISESDLVFRQSGDAPNREAGPGATPDDRSTATLDATRLMTRPAITVDTDETVAGAARVMAEHRVERLPVVDGQGHLVGIVTRRDLLQVFLRPDAEIRREIVDDLFERTLWLPPGKLIVKVADGVVTLEGQLERLSEILVAVKLAQQVDGVIEVVDRVTYLFDDSPVGRAEDRVGHRRAIRERSP
ncbi:CBS domain-containing protein [Streptomyces sp. SCSIO 30461]|uniref:CBS domain-containing protein n=1 Tax=Streptomyces sp. SCSIO 30461 TaxID=3118085 RepID=UPI0030CE1736